MSGEEVGALIGQLGAKKGRKEGEPSSDQEDTEGTHPSSLTKKESSEKEENDMAEYKAAEKEKSTSGATANGKSKSREKEEPEKPSSLRGGLDTMDSDSAKSPRKLPLIQWNRTAFPGEALDGTEDKTYAVKTRKHKHNQKKLTKKDNERFVVQNVITSRADISQCFAASLEEAHRKCRHNASAAFLCPAGQNPCSHNTATLMVKDAIVLDPRGVVASPQDGIVYDVSGGCCLNSSQVKHWRIGQTLPVPTKSSGSPLLLLKHNHDSTYYHFAIELMGRLAAIPEYIHSMLIEGNDGNKRLSIMTPQSTSFHQAYLDLMLCPSNQTRCYVEATHTTGMDLHPYVFLPPVTRFHHNVPLQQRLHNATRPAMCPDRVDPQQKPKFVVIERAKSRRVLNLRSFVELLTQMHPDVDFVVVPEEKLSRMGLMKYASLFCGASGIIGGHGAGLSNMIWLDPAGSRRSNIVVAQIIRPGQTGNVYPWLARRIGYKYVEISSVLAGGGKSTYENTRIENLCAAEEQLRPALATVNNNNKTIPFSCELFLKAMNRTG